MKKKAKFIPLFLFIFIFQLLYFLSTVYAEKIGSLFLILAIFMVLICILLYRILSNVLKKSNAEIELSFLQKQRQLEHQQEHNLQIRRKETTDFQNKTIQKLLDFQTLLKQGQYEQADAAIKNLSQSFERERFHPYCHNNLLQAILEGKRLSQSNPTFKYLTKSFYQKRVLLIWQISAVYSSICLTMPSKHVMHPAANLLQSDFLQISQTAF